MTQLICNYRQGVSEIEDQVETLQYLAPLVDFINLNQKKRIGAYLMIFDDN